MRDGACEKSPASFRKRACELGGKTGFLSRLSAGSIEALANHWPGVSKPNYNFKVPAGILHALIPSGGAKDSIHGALNHENMGCTEPDRITQWMSCYHFNFFK